MLAPFDGFHETQHAVTGTCLISFDRNRYSVAARAVRRAVQVRAYADRIVVRLGDEVVAEHPRCFGRDRTIYDPWHYLPVLVKKPGALRNGAPFQGWDLLRTWRTNGALAVERQTVNGRDVPFVIVGKPVEPSEIGSRPHLQTCGAEGAESAGADPC